MAKKSSLPPAFRAKMGKGKKSGPKKAKPAFLKGKGKRK